jgi:hypothetical protein
MNHWSILDGRVHHSTHLMLRVGRAVFAIAPT